MLPIEVCMTFWIGHNFITSLIISVKIADLINVNKISRISYGKVVQNKSEVEYLSRIFLMLLPKNYLMTKNPSLEKKCLKFLQNCKAGTRKIKDQKLNLI